MTEKLSYPLMSEVEQVLNSIDCPVIYLCPINGTIEYRAKSGDPWQSLSRDDSLACYSKGYALYKYSDLPITQKDAICFYAASLIPKLP